MLTLDDWANTGYRFCKCIEMLGINIIGYKGNPHNFCYPKQLAIHSSITNAKYLRESPIIVHTTDLANLVERAKAVHFIASTLVDTGIDLHDKKVVMQHGGTTYRLNAEANNTFLNTFVNKHIIQFPSILGLGAKNEHLIYYPVDTEFIKPDGYDRMNRDKLIIGHFPSDWTSKGTKTILNVIRKLEEDSRYKDKFEYVGLRYLDNNRRVFWYDNLERMRQCDVIIETIMPELRGKPFGEWGNTALEAAAMGKVVITNTLNMNTYRKEYGTIPLHFANNGEELKNAIIECLAFDLKKAKKNHREWAHENHGMKATSKRIGKLIYGDLL